MSHSEIINEIEERIGEYLEMVHPNSRTDMINDVLISLLIKERQLNEYYKRRIHHASIP